MNQFSSKILYPLGLCLGFFASQPAYAALDVTASIRPLALLAEYIATEDDRITTLLPADRSPHHYQLKVSERRQIQETDLVVWVGEELESFLTKAVEQRDKPNLTTSELESLDWPEGGGQPDPHGHDHGDKDPHLWLDPDNLILVSQALAEKMAELNPKSASHYLQKAVELGDLLLEQDQELQQQFQGLSQRGFIALHPAYGHFVEHYGLKQIEHIVTTPEAPLSARHLYKLKQQRNAVCVLGEYGQDNSSAEKLSEDLGAQFAKVDLFGFYRKENKNNSKISVLPALTETLVQCLGPQKS